MPAFNYRVRDKFGQPVRGIMGGDSKSAVVAKLRKMGYTPISVTEVKDGLGISNFFRRFKRVRFSDLNMFSRQFATLQKAGLPILLSLNALKEQTAHKILKDVLAQIMRDIEGGASLSSALGRHPRIFNVIYVSMIKSGEVSGTLDAVLERLATLAEHEEKVRLRIKATTRYPVMVIAAMIAAFFILITLVVPRFSGLYSQFAATLPLPTRILLGINYIITRFCWLVLFAAGAFTFALNRFINTKRGRLWWDNLKLRFPVFGPLTVKLIMSRFTRFTGTLMRSGIPVLEVLELTQDVAGNVIIARTINNIKKSAAEGKGLFEPMKESAMFPPVVTQMVLVGEESGKVDELLLYVADYYESQLNYMINNLIALIEPLLILALGGMVLFMALGIFLPMWNMIRLFR